MAASGFSIAIVHGLRQRGYDDAAITAMLGITSARLKAIDNGRAQLTERQFVAIERETDRSIAQLAALKIEPHGGPYTRLANQLARHRSRAPHATRRVVRSA